MRRARLALGEAGAFVCGGRLMRARRAWAWLALPFARVFPGCRSSGPPPSESAARVIELSADSLLAIPGVAGVYEGLSGDEPVIRIMLASKADSLVRRMPKRLGGYRVELEFGGPVVPLGR